MVMYRIKQANVQEVTQESHHEAILVFTAAIVELKEEGSW